MDIRSGAGYPASALSNFAPHPFILDGVLCNSMEGFLQSLKFQDLEVQAQVCTLVGLAAKRRGRSRDWQRTQCLWWRGGCYFRDGDAYKILLDRAYQAMCDQNERFRKALLATRSATLTHSMGGHKKSETILTQSEFVSRLAIMRYKLQTEKMKGD
jgi:predicted NAD-dependent protein-ADP-ribosyltransferase YbiA (DUF1768 family)